MKKKIELLCPAGDLERLKTAVAFGADAVYCGLSDWSMRSARELTFTIKTLKEGIEFAHKNSAKVYLTFNVYIHESQIKKAEEDLKKIKKAGLTIDGIVVSDFAMIDLIKKILPKASIHISTQTNTLNSGAVMFWQKMGAERVVLAREVTFSEIKEIKKKVPNAELEVFGHGAMCMAYSGRCLLSKYFTGREANLGDCAQSCRWKYGVKKLKKQEIKKLTNQEDRFFLEEETRPNDLLEVQEDANGTYFMNSKEICSIDIMDKFIESGIDSLKIEGRAKTVYYLATVTRAYRKAIDLYYAGKYTKKAVKELQGELDLIQNRGYSHGFLMSKCGYEQEYKIAAFKPPVMFIGVVLECRMKNVECRILVQVKNKFKTGERIEIVTPNEIIKTKILEIKDKKGNILEEILTPQEEVWLKFDTKKEISERSILRRRL
jgi:putative protease